MQQANTASRPPRMLMQKLRVPLSFLIGVTYLIGTRPSPWSVLLGLPVALLGLAIRAWASGHLRKGVELATSGPYAHSRNPLYFGSFLMAVGCAIAGGSIALGAALVAFFLLIYWRVMRLEAAQMLARFGNEYRCWALQVPMFIPRVKPFVAAVAHRFDRRQYLRHREYRAAIGLLVAMLVLCIKTVLPFPR